MALFNTGVKILPCFHLVLCSTGNFRHYTNGDSPPINYGTKEDNQGIALLSASYSLTNFSPKVSLNACNCLLSYSTIEHDERNGNAQTIKATNMMCRFSTYCYRALYTLP